MTKNTAKQRLLEGKPAIGAQVGLGSPLSAEMISPLGFDFVLVTVSEEGGRQPRCPNFRRGVGVRHRPPEVEPRNPCAPLELGGDFVVLGRRDATESR